MKRRKMETGYVTNGQAYDSQDDSGDNLFADFETVATVPLHQPLPQRISSDMPPSHTVHITQPTQIISKGTSKLGAGTPKSSVIQVPASSPARMPNATSPKPTNAKRHAGSLASTMAPAGTAFRSPMGVTKPPVVTLLSDDEGPTYRGGSSEDESQTHSVVDIKPSTFIQSAQRISREKSTTNPTSDSSTNLDRFKAITSDSFYKPIDTSKTKAQASTLSGSVYDSRNRDEKQTTSRLTTSSKQSADVMANAYGGSRRFTKQLYPSQTAPAKTRPVEDMALDDIEDFQLRQKIKRMRTILLRHSILACKQALLTKKGNFDDAVELLTSHEGQAHEIDLTLSDDDPLSSLPQMQTKIPAKQQIKAPVKSIQERWTSTQTLSKSSQPLPSSPVVTKPRRRLIQKKRQPSPVQTKPSSPPSTRILSPDSDDSDSGLGIESGGDAEIESKVLNFLNDCSIADLVDIAAVSDDLATLLLSRKPFRNLNEARQVAHNVSATGKKKTIKRPVGEKIVDKCIDMWTGYEAVDSLVRQCEALGKPVAEEMKKWGVDVFGAAKDGELDIISFDKASGGVNSEGSARDSGIGTPNSTVLSTNDNNDLDAKGTIDQIKKAFSPQPQIMGEGVILKDYQIVGFNWLYLLFQKNLSCILADDMGLGKTCQVIAFLAHLLEKSIKGPHLVVVPGSTLENWLREFSIFCPSLSVMPYYGKVLLYPDQRMR